MSKEFKGQVKLLLPSHSAAQIMKQVLDVDEELQPNRMSREIEVQDNYLVV